MKNKYLLGLGNYSKNADGIGLCIVEHIIDNSLDKDFESRKPVLKGSCFF
ncbi:MAG: hypothetical protein U9O87_00545 [Verrucomicrobiota bacterium]|nr:hypothetical protein [Verrucomicrobiota bacterium]